MHHFNGFAGFMLKLAMAVLIAVSAISCTMSVPEEAAAIPEVGWDVVDPSGYGGPGPRFKIPLPKGYDWEIVQSWGSHCRICNNKSYDSIYGNYCDASSTHMGNCCRYAWDFNLPGTSDRGKSILASGGGTVYDTRTGSEGWGHYVVIDHGDNLCTRYAHMLEGSITVSEGDFVCQGLKIGEIGESGFATGEHLHFQFEKCDTKTPIARGFDDGNRIPVCTIGNDRYNSRREYTALQLTNDLVESCDDGPSTFGGGSLGEGGWIYGACGSLSNCPMIPNCGREANHRFRDSMSERTAKAATYLYGECALDGKSDGQLHPYDRITRAEALKIAMYLFGLMDNCGTREPFADVDEDDWFFPVVACAVKHRIVSTVSSYFNPNAEVQFGEAAKMLVEAAAKAGVIQLRNPVNGHFRSIPKSHWSYPYVETVYVYGGTEPTMLRYSYDTLIDREDFILMAAALSPCFCGNVRCRSGCVCDQASFACVDPNDRSSGTGGGSANSDDEEEEYLEEDFEEEDDQSSDFDIECLILPESSRCVGTNTAFRIKCTLSNFSDSLLKVRDMIMSIVNPGFAPDCSVTVPSLHGGSSYQTFEVGETKRLTGHHEITCGDFTGLSAIEVSFELVEKLRRGTASYPEFIRDRIMIPSEGLPSCRPNRCIPDCAGKACGPDSCGSSCGSCGPDATCNNAIWQCISDSPAPVREHEENQGNQRNNPPAPQWVCPQNTGYRILLSSPGGWFQINTSGPEDLPRTDFPPNMDMNVHFDCADLPAVIHIIGGPSGVFANPQGANPPDIGVWVPFFGPLDINQPRPPDVVAQSFNTNQRYQPVLIRVPAN